MSYVDGFVAAVPTANREAFRQHALQAAEFFRENGALQVAECWPGKLTDFLARGRQSVASRSQGRRGSGPEETVVFSWVVWPCREVRDAAHARMMGDPRLAQDANPMPFDGSRLIYGGFEMIVEA